MRVFEVRQAGEPPVQFLSFPRAQFRARRNSVGNPPTKVVAVDLDRKTDDAPCGDCPGDVLAIFDNGSAVLEREDLRCK